MAKAGEVTKALLRGPIKAKVSTGEGTRDGVTTRDVAAAVSRAGQHDSDGVLGESARRVVEAGIQSLKNSLPEADRRTAVEYIKDLEALRTV